MKPLVTVALGPLKTGAVGAVTRNKRPKYDISKEP